MNKIVEECMRPDAVIPVDAETTGALVDEVRRLAGIVADCARMREAPREPFKIADAISEAQWMERTPDGVVAPSLSRQTIRTLHAALQASPCYYKGAILGVPTFTLLAYDRAGHAAMRLWAQLAEQHGARPEKWSSALAMVLAWERRDDLRWPT